MQIPVQMFKALSPEEEAEVRASARKDYYAGDLLEAGWHPVYIHECYLMAKEAGILEATEVS